MDQIYDLGDNGLWVFILVTCVLGGTGALVSGRAMAQTWRPFWHLPPQFLHHAHYDCY